MIDNFSKFNEAEPITFKDVIGMVQDNDNTHRVRLTTKNVFTSLSSGDTKD